MPYARAGYDCLGYDTASSTQGLPLWEGGWFQPCGSLPLFDRGFILHDPAERMNQSPVGREESPPWGVASSIMSSSWARQPFRTEFFKLLKFCNSVITGNLMELCLIWSSGRGKSWAL